MLAKNWEWNCPPGKIHLSPHYAPARFPVLSFFRNALVQIGREEEEEGLLTFFHVAICAATAAWISRLSEK
jgi:hypothetical protein